MSKQSYVLYMFIIMVRPHPLILREEGENTDVREKTALSYRSFTF